MKITLIKKFPSLPIIFLSLLIVTTGIGCGGGGSGSPAPVDQDAQGLYTTNGNGSGTFKNGTNPDIVKTLTDIKGMVYGDLPNQQFIFFDIGTNVLYKGDITAITLTDFVGTATVYNDGVMVDNNVAVSGTVISRSNISMTLATSGNFSGGSVAGLFSTEYDNPATNARAVVPGGNVWESTTVGSVKMIDDDLLTSTFDVKSNGTYGFFSNTLTGSVRCDFDGLFVSGNTKNIYSVEETTVVNDPGPCLNISLSPPNPNYVRFSSVLADNAQGEGTEMWYAITNGLHSVFAILTR